MRQLMKYRVVDEIVCDEDSMATASERSGKKIAVMK
jgi:hypothetical protein